MIIENEDGTTTNLRVEVQGETLTRFINRNRITASVEWADNNPNMEADKEWNRGASHWKITLRCRGRQMTTYFSQGSAISGLPTAADLLDCLASDSSGIENARSFEDWCSEYGYDTDSRKAEKTFKVCERQAQKLKTFLPSGEYEMLLWHVERQ
jgi:hypothetical protein